MHEHNATGNVLERSYTHEQKEECYLWLPLLETVEDFVAKGIRNAVGPGPTDPELLQISRAQCAKCLACVGHPSIQILVSMAHRKPPSKH